MTPVTISVIVTVYNGERYIGESLTAILSQTSPPLEVIVVDDGSTDETPSELRRFGADIRIITQANRGHAPALNRGFRDARGDYLAKCDADDIWAPEKLERQLDAIRRHPEIDIAFAGARFFGLTEGPRAPYPDAGMLDGKQLARRLYRANSVCASTTLVRRRLFEQLGPFAEDLAAEDYDYWLRALAAGARFFYDPEVLVNFRHHEENISSNKLAMHRAEMLVHERHAELMRRPALTRRALARDQRHIGRELSDLDRPHEARSAFLSALRRWPTIRALVWVLLLSTPGRIRRPLATHLVSLKRALYTESPP